MSIADRLSVVGDLTSRGQPRLCIKLDNEGRRRDMYLVNFHPDVSKETAEAVLAVLKADEHMRRVLK